MGDRAADLSDGQARSTAARGDHALIAPPFIVTEGDVDEIVCRFATAVDRAIAAAASGAGG